MGQRIAVMKEGVLQQCDTPLTLYHSPANMFVAGFLGTPGMNFVPDARLVRRDGATIVEAGEFSVTLPPARAAKLADRADGPVVLGIRPQSIFPAATAPPAVAQQGNAMRALVEVIEPMGAVSTLFLLMGGKTLVAEVDADTNPGEGQTIDLLLDGGAIHLFDPTTEQAIA